MTQPSKKSAEAEGLPAAPKTFTSPPMLGSAEGWSLIQGMVDAVAAEAAKKPRVDLQSAAESALSVCDDVRGDPALYARFQKMAETGEFTADGFRQLQRLAAGAWYARRMRLRAESTDSDATVPPELVAQGGALVGRMLSVVTYYVGQEPSVAPVLAGISVAPGHRRLANNLHELADLYQAHRAAIEVDTVKYRASDERDARETASAIIAALADASTGGAELWSGRCARVWTLLSAAYGEVQEVGRFLLRKTPDVAKERFPSLVTDAREPTQARKAAEPAAPVTDPATPADPAAEPTRPRAATPKRRRKR